MSSHAPRTAKRSLFAVFLFLAFQVLACVETRSAGLHPAERARGESRTPSRPAAEPVVAPPALVKHMRRLGFLPLAMLLPDADGWVALRDDPQRYEAAHGASASRLVADVLDGAFGTSVQCALSGAPSRPPTKTRIDEGSVRAPLALDVAFETFAEELADHSVAGTLVAYAAYGGRCTQIRFETKASGAESAAEVGARLRFLRDVSLPSLLVVRDGHAPNGPRTNLERR